jgi:hypothetical protein
LRSPSPASSPGSVGRWTAPTDRGQLHARSVEERRDLAHAREHLRPKHEQPRPRSILDSTALTTQPGPAAENRA